MTRCGVPRVAVGLLCVTLLGPERFTLDDLALIEYRVRLCTQAHEPHVLAEARTYERLLGARGYRYRRVGETEEYDQPQERWWTTERDVRLYVTTEPGATVP